MSRVLVIGSINLSLVNAVLAQSSCTGCEVFVVQDTERVIGPKADESLREIKAQQEAYLITSANAKILEDYYPPSKSQPFYMGIKKYKRWNR